MRLIALDMARFWAFVGMVLVNFRIAAEVVDEAGFAAALTHSIEGRAAALFVVLAGIGLGLGRPDWRITAKRAVFLFVLGLLDVLIFEADILHFYALYFLCAIPVLGASHRMLTTLTFATILLGVLALLAFNYEAGWDWDSLAYEGFWTLPGFLRHSFYNGWHPVLPWVAFLFWGMALSRFDLARRALQLRLLIIGAFGAAGFALLSRLLAPLPEIGDVFLTSPIPPGPLYMLAAGASATAFIGGALLLEPLLTRLHVAQVFAAPGRQTLTLYVAHVLLGMGTLETLGRLDGSLSSGQIFTYSLGFSALAALYALVWSRWFKRGPLETLMRLTTETRR